MELQKYYPAHLALRACHGVLDLLRCSLLTNLSEFQIRQTGMMMRYVSFPNAPRHRTFYCFYFYSSSSSSSSTFLSFGVGVLDLTQFSFIQSHLMCSLTHTRTHTHRHTHTSCCLEVKRLIESCGGSNSDGWKGLEKAERGDSWDNKH